jgi:hypothetical protein
MLKSDYQQCTHNFIFYSSIGRNSQFKKEKRMENKKITKYEYRFEVASERNKISGYTLIPHNTREAEAQHMTEHDALQAIQRHALKGETEEVKRLLLEFPEFKREDLKKMLIRSVATQGRTLEI